MINNQHLCNTFLNLKDLIIFWTTLFFTKSENTNFFISKRINLLWKKVLVSSSHSIIFLENTCKKSVSFIQFCFVELNIPGQFIFMPERFSEFNFENYFTSGPYSHGFLNGKATKTSIVVLLYLKYQLFGKWESNKPTILFLGTIQKFRKRVDHLDLSLKS